MTRAVRLHEHGGPEVLRLEEIEIGRPGPGEARVRHEAIGVNFIDTYYRKGQYAAPGGLPLIPGAEGAGVVEEVGEGVDHLSVGDRVAYSTPTGAYCSDRLIAADRLVKIPDNIDAEQAAAMMLKGMTAELLLRRTFQIRPGDTVLFHAASGGVGLIAGQWAKHLGATVIGTAGSPEKVQMALAHGFDHVINYRDQDFVAAVTEITGGRKCDVVYDGVGKDTFPGSLDCLRPRGLFVCFGLASGPVPPFDIMLLAQKGSLYATRPTIFTYNSERADLVASANALFEIVGSGAVKIAINQRYALADAAQAHADLEGRRTSGTTVLLP